MLSCKLQMILQHAYHPSQCAQTSVLVTHYESRTQPRHLLTSDSHRHQHRLTLTGIGTAGVLWRSALRGFEREVCISRAQLIRA